MRNLVTGSFELGLNVIRMLSVQWNIENKTGSVRVTSDWCAFMQPLL